MRNLLVAAMLVAGAGTVAWWAGIHDGNAAPARGAMSGFRTADRPAEVPELAFVGAGGERLSLGDFRGRVVLLNLWATWCAPCVEEMPALDRLQAARGGRDFEVVALSLDRGGRAQVAPFLDRLGVRNLRIYLDPSGAAMGALGPRGLPTTILIDREGREVGRLEGAAEWDSADALRLIEHYLDGTRGPDRDAGPIRTSG
ncbi:MAG TPA: TlpA disulfide reductase family protein [Arenibaculum sp.]|nr:TlpA disulfide reductase family protein [Arenibaculum sp.]